MPLQFCTYQQDAFYSCIISKMQTKLRIPISVKSLNTSSISFSLNTNRLHRAFKSKNAECFS